MKKKKNATWTTKIENHFRKKLINVWPFSFFNVYIIGGGEGIWSFEPKFISLKVPDNVIELQPQNSW